MRLERRCRLCLLSASHAWQRYCVALVAHTEKGWNPQSGSALKPGSNSSNSSTSPAWTLTRFFVLVFMCGAIEEFHSTLTVL